MLSPKPKPKAHLDPTQKAHPDTKETGFERRSDLQESHRRQSIPSPKPLDQGQGIPHISGHKPHRIVQHIGSEASIANPAVPCDPEPKHHRTTPPSTPPFPRRDADPPEHRPQSRSKASHKKLPSLSRARLGLDRPPSHTTTSPTGDPDDERTEQTPESRRQEETEGRDNGTSAVKREGCTAKAGRCCGFSKEAGILLQLGRRSRLGEEAPRRRTPNPRRDIL